MSPPRFRLLRSQLFWGGAFGLAFLLWAWVDSLYNYSAILCYGRQNGIGFVQDSGAVKIAMQHGAGIGRGPDVGHARIARSSVGKPFARFQMARSGGVQPFVAIKVPHWALLAAYLVLWASLLLWRWRRRARPHAPIVERG